MSHVVFLVGPYYPNFSAVGYCAYQVQKCLMDEFDISVVAFRNDIAQPVEEAHLGMMIHRIETNLMSRRNSLQDQSGRLAGARFFALRVWGAIRRLMAPQTIDGALVQAYLECLNNLEVRPDAIVPLAFPFEAVLAALQYKKSNPDVAVFPYLFDDFVDSGSLHVLKIAGRLKRRRHLSLERRMLEEADAVLSMHPLREHFETNFDKSLLGKITFLEHPLLTRPQASAFAPRYGNGMIRLCFTGSLIRNVREPNYLLKLLDKVRVEAQVRADFFVMGNAAHKVRTKMVNGLVSIVNHGHVTKPEADAAIHNADILINIGEVKGKQVSSKIFEYMATGKPIVHLAYIKDDVVSKILAKYPLSLCLVQDRRRLNESALELSEFIKERHSSILPFSDVVAIYPEAVPEETANIITGYLKHNELSCGRINASALTVSS